MMFHFVLSPEQMLMNKLLHKISFIEPLLHINIFASISYINTHLSRIMTIEHLEWSLTQ